MKRPAIFFDRDNTLIVADGYLGDPSRVQLVEGVATAITRGRELGFAIIAFSNQSGVARGMFSEDDVRAVNARVDELLVEQDAKAKIDRHEFCPDHPEATVEQYRRDSDRRKPGAGMLRSAAEALDLDLSKSWVIGDAPRDIEAGHAAGCRTILFAHPDLPRSPAADAEMKVKPDHTCATLEEAIDIIAKANGGSRASAVKSTPNSSSTPAAIPDTDLHKLAQTADQILYELRRRNEPITDFSVTKLLAGIAQVISVAIVFVAYLNREDKYTSGAMLIFALWLQTLTVALLIMQRQH
jgi:D-glycero-D-manno-heptose 1,7-bisphosphate phosphatase